LSCGADIIRHWHCITFETGRPVYSYHVYEERAARQTDAWRLKSLRATIEHSTAIGRLLPLVSRRLDIENTAKSFIIIMFSILPTPAAAAAAAATVTKG